MADSSTQIMAAQGVTTGANLGNTFSQMSAIRAQSGYERDQLKANARIQEMAAADALKRGDKAIGRAGEQAAALRGEQRVAAAGQGIVAGRGSSARLVANADQRAIEDVATLRSNSIREAWGYRMQAQSYNSAARMNKIAARGKIAQTAIAGGAQFGRDAMRAYELNGSGKWAGEGREVYDEESRSNGRWTKKPKETY